MSEENCIFCRFAREGGEGVFQQKGLGRFIAIPCRYPVSPGHMLLIPNYHVATLYGLDPWDWQVLRNHIRWAKHLIEIEVDWSLIYAGWYHNPLDEQSKKFCLAAYNHPRIGTKPDGYNWGVNEGLAAGQTVPHLHIHVIPRYQGDVEDPTGGVRHVIPGKGNYKK